MVLRCILDKHTNSLLTADSSLSKLSVLEFRNVGTCSWTVVLVVSFITLGSIKYTGKIQVNVSDPMKSNYISSQKTTVFTHKEP